jgi:hypothetical protein
MTIDEAKEFLEGLTKNLDKKEKTEFYKFFRYILTGSETGLPLEKTIYLLEMVNKGETKKRIIDFVESNNLADSNGKFMITLFKNLRRE